VTPPTREEFEARLHQALAGDDDVEYRANLGLQCWTFMGRVWQRRMNAASARSQWTPCKVPSAWKALASRRGGQRYFEPGRPLLSLSTPR